MERKYLNKQKPGRMTFAYHSANLCLWCKLTMITVIKTLIILHCFNIFYLSDEELDGIIEELDEDGSGSMDFDEFCEMMMTKPE